MNDETYVPNDIDLENISLTRISQEFRKVAF